MDDIFRQVEELRQYGTMLQKLVEEFQRSAPERSTGSDPTGAVQVAVGPDGLPETIKVSPYWREKLQPEAFAGAVNAACLAAVHQRGAEWAETMRRSGWQERLARLDADAASAAAAEAAGPNPVPPAYRRASPPANGRTNGRPVRPLTEIAERAISLLDTTMSTPAMTGQVPQPPHGTGGRPDGALQLSVSSEGQVVCQAMPQWVSQQSGAQLQTALSSALATARQRLAAAVAAARGPAAEIKRAADELQQEILGVLSDLQGLS
jgi:hypothetical protein